MATFVNQTSNLSALGSAIESFSSVLDSSSDNRRHDSSQEPQEQAQMFLQSQRDRIAVIDKQLFHAAGAIIPAQREMKTATELAELCRLVQERSRRKLSFIGRELSSKGVELDIPWDDAGDSKKESPSTPKCQSLLQFSTGGPLESVIEGDLETEGTITPGSLIQPSPFYSATRQRKKSITPPTPTMDTFSFSAGTNDLIHNISAGADNNGGKTDTRQRSPVVSRHLSNTPNSTNWSNNSVPSVDRQLRFDEFYDEDDMITLESRSTLAQRSPAPRSPVKEDRSQFLARMESTLERVEESVFESRPSDETEIMRELNASTNFSNRSNASDDGRSEADDDSTNVVATQIATKSDTTNIKQRRLLSPGRTVDKRDEKEGSKVQRPVQIFVDTAASSPAHTNITMDITMMNDAFGGMSILADDDNSSIVTPILDRYRLDPDDNSVGIKVVPNQRGIHGKHRESIGVSMDISEDSANKKQEFYTSPEGVRSPVGLPSTVSARKKTYRKTPFARRHFDDSSFDAASNENTNPNFKGEGERYRTTPFPKKIPSDDGSSNSFGGGQSDTSSNMIYPLEQRATSQPDINSFSIPPLRPRSFETSKPVSIRSSSSRSTSLPAIPKSRSPMSDAFIAKHFEQDSPRRKDPPKLSLQRIERITMAEYERAPNIVRMQVRRNEANDSLDALEEFLGGITKDSEFTEKEGYRVLQHLLDSNQKRKSVLMSLCHWRRLLMFRDETNGMIFRVNQFEQLG